MKLSVIVPVYRTEKTLDRCVKSIINQTFTDLEVILVDDGSPDLCPQMCDDWALRDSRIHVIHKPNTGLSEARNAGLARAVGDFVTFVDSDDFLSPDTYQQVMPLTEKHDLVEFPIFCFYGSHRQHLLQFRDKDYCTPAEYWLEGKAYEHAYACNKIFRRELFLDTPFPKGRVFEDVALLPLILTKAKHIRTTDGGLYYYCDNPEGITNQAGYPQLDMLLESHINIINKWFDERYYLHVLNIQIDIFELSGKLHSLPFRRINPFARGLSPKLRIKAFFLDIIGIKGLCSLCKVIHGCHIRCL